MSSLAAIKAATQSKALEDQTNSERQREILVLILSHLQSQGYIETATALLNESRTAESLEKYDLADNIDLMQVLKEYDEYCKMKFGRRPVFCRFVSNRKHNGMAGNGSDETASRKYTRGKRRSRNSHHGHQSHRENSTDHVQLPPLSTNHATPGTNKPLRSRKRTLQEEEQYRNDDIEQGIKGSALNSPTKTRNDDPQTPEGEPRPLLKPLPNFDGDHELRSLAMSIRRDIVQECPRVAWSDIVGLNDAKRLLKEAIILPRQYPQLFTGLRSPWKSALLYGVPGTGKTLLAKAVATESKTTFFNISASSIVSKFRGDSEKLIRMLFDLARYYAPSTVFIDEVDSIMSHRGNGSSPNEGSEHEGSRRMKTELLVQMDGLLANSSNVFVLAASNLPWDLDPAFLRRMEKRIMIPLPTKECRKDMIRSHLSEFSPAFRQGEVLEEAASLLDGYSGSDIKGLCKEVAMRPLRRILRHAEVLDGSSNHENLSLLMKRNPITAQDFHEALATVNHSTSAELYARQRKWEESHGST
ncbi:hypothetical protein ACHAXR_004865 [Thalassiosira sp. AJA248-18]